MSESNRKHELVMFFGVGMMLFGLVTLFTSKPESADYSTGQTLFVLGPLIALLGWYVGRK